MKNGIYSVFDSKAAVYGTPYFIKNDAMAIRAFGDLVNDRNTLAFRHPQDFTLFKIGEFDDVLGEVVPCVPVGLVTASSLMKRVVNGKTVTGIDEVLESVS